MRLGERIKSLRRENNMSLRTLAEKTGLSKTTLGDLENNAKNPSLETVQKIATAFDISLSDLLNEDCAIETIVTSAKDSTSPLLNGLAKSENLMGVLYRAKDMSKDNMDQMASFLEALISSINSKQ